MSAVQIFSIVNKIKKVGKHMSTNLASTNGLTRRCKELLSI